MKRRGITEQPEMEAEEVNEEQFSRNREVISHALTASLEGVVNESKDVAEVRKTENQNANYGQNSRRAYLSELRKVVEKADIVINVLDARDPIGTRSTTIEEMTAQYSRKKIIYVLNKADLVPKEVLEGWIKYLRQYHPTIPFKSNTQAQKSHLGTTSGKVLHHAADVLQTSQSIGSEELLNLLKNYCRVDSTSSKTIITVGIVGFPNVGKSSVINSLMRIRAVGVSAVPGFTKNLQEVILDKNIRLIDSPGVVFADGNNPNTALRNVVNIEDMTDVLTPIHAIVDKCPAAYLMQIYNIPKFTEKDAVQFLSLVAKANGKLKKGGIPNTDAAARLILHDWNSGKIKYYCKPPAEFMKSTAASHGRVEVDLGSMVDQGSSKGKASKKSAIKGETQLGFNLSDDSNLEMEGLPDRIIGQLHEESKNDVYVAMDTFQEPLAELDN
jgi:nuclear GTP-binding protein